VTATFHERAVAGVVWAVIMTPRAEIVVIGAVVLTLMLSFEKILERRFRFRPAA
jgi:hypothetical protein